MSHTLSTEQECGKIPNVAVYVRPSSYQLYTVAILILPLWFLIASFYLHGLEWFGEIVTLCEVLGPLGYVGLQQCTFLAMFHHTLQCGEYSKIIVWHSTRLESRVW